MAPSDPSRLGPDAAVLVTDLQNDFLPGGALGIAGGDEIVPDVNAWIAAARAHGAHVIVTRDWHPADHTSFRARGGPWPAHAVQGTRGAELTAALRVPASATIVSKGTDRDREAYSAFDGTGLDGVLAGLGVRRLLVCGLATEYCVLETVRDACARGLTVFVLVDLVRAVDPAAGERALTEMWRLGAEPLQGAPEA